MRQVLIVVLALAGIGVSGYLAYVYLIDVSVACVGGSYGCDIVKASPYAWVGPIPVPVLGLAGYFLILGLAVGKRWLSSVMQAQATLVLFALSLVGTLYSAYLTYLEFFVIYAVCQWCIASAIIMTLIFVLVLIEVASQNQNVEASRND